MMTKDKMTITDPVYGSISLTDLQAELIQTVEVQRLNAIHQLGMTYQVYPSAHSMRFSHALGVSHLARRMGEELILQNEKLSLTDKNREYFLHLLIAAGLLHDVCHTPWSHTLEPLFIELFGQDHMDMTRELLTGKIRWPLKGTGKIPEILNDYGINPEDVSDLISKSFTGPSYLQQMIFGEVDADTLDYLCRDFTFTGVSFGHIDVNRLLQTMIIHSDRLYFQIKGLQAVRDFLNARVEMYSAVYFHKKTRIADLMFLRAAKKSIIDQQEFQDFWIMTDDEFLSTLVNQSSLDFVRDMAWRLKYRQGLFKRVFHIEAGSVTLAQKRFLKVVSMMGETPAQAALRLEDLILQYCNIPSGYVIVDLVSAAADISESRFKELNILFLDKGDKAIPLRKVDKHFAEYIRQAQPSRSILSIYVPEEYRDQCIDVLPKLLSRLTSEETT